METILVVDDEVQVRALARDILVGAGYRVLEAEDGETALQIAEEHQVGCRAHGRGITSALGAAVLRSW